MNMKSITSAALTITTLLFSGVFLASSGCGGLNEIDVTGYQIKPAIYSLPYSYTQWSGSGKVIFETTNAIGFLTVSRSKEGAYQVAGSWPCSPGTDRLLCNATGLDNGWTPGFFFYRAETTGDLSMDGGVISDTFWAGSGDSVSIGSDLYHLGPLTWYR